MSQNIDWKEVCSVLLDAIEAAGAVTGEVDNGGGWTVTNTREELLSELTASDTAHLKVRLKDPGEVRDYATVLFLVFGNEPHELLADYGSRDWVDRLADDFEARCQGREFTLKCS